MVWGHLLEQRGKKIGAVFWIAVLAAPHIVHHAYESQGLLAVLARRPFEGSCLEHVEHRVVRHVPVRLVTQDVKGCHRVLGPACCLIEELAKTGRLRAREQVIQVAEYGEWVGRGLRALKLGTQRVLDCLVWRRKCTDRRHEHEEG